LIEVLANQQPLEERFRDHALVGNFDGCRECHIRPDWLLIYQANQTDLVLIRTGTHNDLFG
jgi:mRNA interferase YafQ